MLPVRKSYLDPQPIIGTIAYTIEKTHRIMQGTGGEKGRPATGNG